MEFQRAHFAFSNSRPSYRRAARGLIEPAIGGDVAGLVLDRGRRPGERDLMGVTLSEMRSLWWWCWQSHESGL
jgi:hypothetical protein